MSSSDIPGVAAPSQTLRRRALLGGALLGGAALASPSRREMAGSALAGTGHRYADSRLAFAHYFGPYPRSLDNAVSRASDYYTQQLLNPAGESGKHAAYGGFFRDRPIYRPRDPSVSWRTHDCQFDISTAQNAGLDGFFVNILSQTGASWDRNVTLRQAAEHLDTGFRIVPMLDTTGRVAAAGPVAAAGAIAQFARGRSAWRLADGRSVFASFKTEQKSLDWWQEVIRRLRDDHRLRTAFISVALNAATHPAYQAITYAESVWSYGADPASISHAADYASRARQRGKLFMAPVNGQDCRPYAGRFNEAGNTEATRAAWEKLIQQQADFAQIVTWSDFSEGSAIAPSEARGCAPLRLTSRYLRRWKIGTAVSVGTEEMIISHRSNFTGSRPKGDQTRLMTQGISRHRTAARDTVEVLTFLTAPAEVQVRLGDRTLTYPAPAGTHARLEPLALGTCSGRIVRSGRQVVTVDSTVPVREHPIRDDKQYFWFSSVGTDGQRPPWPV